MNTTNAEGLESSPHDRTEQSVSQTVETFVGAVTDALASSDADSDVVEDVEDTGSDVVDAVGELEERVDELEKQPEIDIDESDPIGSFRVDGAPLGRAVTSKASHTDVEEAVAEIENTEGGSGDTTPTPKAGKDQLQTPLERVCGLPEHVAGDNLTANQERARFVAQGVRDYGRQVPAGIGIRSSEIRRVLSASEESSIHTQTVTRVMDFLDELGSDDVQVRQTRSGERVVVFDEELADRITHVVTHEDGPPVIEAEI